MADNAAEIEQLRALVHTLEARQFDSDAKLSELQEQQSKDESKFKAIAKQQRKNHLVQAGMILIFVCAGFGVTLSEQNQDRLFNVALALLTGTAAIAAPLAKSDEETQ